MKESNFENICSIIYFNDFVYSASYIFENSVKSGFVIKQKILSDSPTNNLSEIKRTKISASFHLLEYKSFIFSFNVDDITVLNTDLEVITIYKTDSSNIFAVLKDDHLIISTENGEILILNLEKFQENNILSVDHKIKITDFIIWSLEIVNDILYIGEDSGILHSFDYKSFLKTKNIKTTLKEIFKEEIGITYIKKIDEKILIASYSNLFELKDGKIIKIDNFGFWRILKYKNFFIIAAGESLKILGRNFEMIKTINLKSHCYGLAIVENTVFFSSFYENKIFSISIE